jgi:hypothetical protein
VLWGTLCLSRWDGISGLQVNSCELGGRTGGSGVKRNVQMIDDAGKENVPKKANTAGAPPKPPGEARNMDQSVRTTSVWAIPRACFCAGAAELLRRFRRYMN